MNQSKILQIENSPNRRRSDETTSSVGTTRRRSTDEESVTADGIANRKRRSTFVDVDSGQLGLVVSRDSTVGKSEGVDPPLVPLVPPYSIGRNDMESPQLTLSARRRSAATEKRTTAILASNSTPSPPLGGGLVLPPTIPTISKQRRSSITGASGSSLASETTGNKNQSDAREEGGASSPSLAGRQREFTKSARYVTRTGKLLDGSASSSTSGNGALSSALTSGEGGGRVLSLRWNRGSSSTTAVASSPDTIPPGVPIVFSPGSPLDLALQASIPKKRVRPRKPKALKVLQKGKEEYERHKQEKKLGKIIDREHKMYHLSYGMMVGIYTSIATLEFGDGLNYLWGGKEDVDLSLSTNNRIRSRTLSGNLLENGALSSTENPMIPPPGTDQARSRVTSAASLPRAVSIELDDFMKVRKLFFPREGSAVMNTPPHALPTSFKFKDYAPSVFYQLRERFSINPLNYLKSLGGAYKFIEFNSNSKSGSFFFYSHDGKFMIKTQSKAESKFLRRILAHYYHHVMSHPETYITRFYGMHRIKMPHLKKTIYFVVMQSVFYGRNEVHEMYDLKGSSVGRLATEKERSKGLAHCVLKDMDLDKKIKLGPGRKEAFLTQIKHDANFLTEMGIMDYSLLVGIHYKSRRGEAERHDLARGAEGDGTKRSSEGEISHDTPQDGYDVDASGSDGETDDIDAHSSAPVDEKSSTRGSGSVGTIGGSVGTGLAPLGSLSISQHGTGAGFRIPVSTDVSGSGTDDERLRRRQTPHSSSPISDSNNIGGESSTSLVSGADGKGISGRDKFGKETDEIYYMGIIDILQQYDLRKLGETVFKSLTMRSKASGISAVPPGRYASRFVEFLDKHSE
jgi:1-phosphatidylinositol-4-phosphate 5-kinase